MKKLSKLSGLSKYLIFEISQCLSLKETLRLGGVCKELHRKIHFSFGEGTSAKYICLRKTGEGVKSGADDKKDLDDLLFDYSAVKTKNALYVTEILLKAGADINTQSNYKHTVLIEASRAGNTEIVKLLLECGNININHQNIYGSTALLIASWYCELKIVKLLLEAGADVNIEDVNGNTALSWARRMGSEEAAELIKNFVS